MDGFFDGATDEIQSREDEHTSAFHARSHKPANKAAHTGYSLFYSAPDLAVATKEC